jgi:hypothetical protein
MLKYIIPISLSFFITSISTRPVKSEEISKVQEKISTFTLEIYHRSQDLNLPAPRPIASSALVKRAENLCYGSTIHHAVEELDFIVRLDSKKLKDDFSLEGNFEPTEIVKTGSGGITTFDDDAIVVFTFKCDGSFSPAKIVSSSKNESEQKGYLSGFVDGVMNIVPIIFVKNNDGTSLRRYYTEDNSGKVGMSGGPVVDSNLNLVAIHKGSWQSKQNYQDLHGVPIDTVLQNNSGVVKFKLTENLSPAIPVITPSFREKPIVNNENPIIYIDKKLAGGQRG